MPRPVWLSLVAGLWALAGCAGSRPNAEPSPSSQNPSAPDAPGPASGAPTAPSSTAASAEPIAVDPIIDADILGALETKGLALRDILPEPAYESLADRLEADIEAARRADPSAGVDVARHAHRLFNARWLRSPSARFDLVGVVNRLDRAAFHEGSCGETRLIYRLGYRTTQAGSSQSSRLPMTIGLEFRVPKPEGDPNCRNVAARWSLPASPAKAVDQLLSEAGPLHASRLGRSNEEFLIVVNVQQVRWPATVRPLLGGHAEYLLRAFRFDPKTKSLKIERLENTPDVARLAGDRALKKELLAWLRAPENQTKIDEGTALLPERFLSERAISVTPRGLGRRKNRPFRQLFSAADFADVSFEGRRFVRSPEGLIRRLDQLSCPGCHEARSVAGFHLLGEDPEDTPAANALAVPLSPHLSEDLARRRGVAGKIRNGESADLAAPFAERMALSQGGYGAHCGLGTDPSFSSWSCDEGLSCNGYDAADDGVGQCLPDRGGQAGDPCEVGSMTANADAQRDSVKNVRKSPCAENAVCNSNGVGFPGGMCTEACKNLSQAGTCGHIAVLDPFNACLARHEPFSKCLTENVRPAGLRACSVEAPCRDDYICAKSPQGSACIPPYFLFQMRVDGHP